MGIRIMLAPWWQRALAMALYGLVAGAAGYALYWWLTGDTLYTRWFVGLLTLCVFAVMFGLVMAATTHRLHLDYEQAAQPIPASDHAAAAKAMWRGPIPADPGVRAVAAEFARIYLYRTRRQILSLLVLAALWVVLFVIGVVTGDVDLLYVALALIFAVVTVWTWYVRRRVQRRAATLA